MYSKVIMKIIGKYAEMKNAPSQTYLEGKYFESIAQEIDKLITTIENKIDANKYGKMLIKDIKNLSGETIKVCGLSDFETWLNGLAEFKKYNTNIDKLISEFKSLDE